MNKLDNLDIREFYTNKKLEEYQHEERLIKTTLDDSENISFWLEDKEQGAKLKDIITNKDKIVLLGNPGIGKTKELENLFKSLWNEKDKTELVPFLLNIKIFKNNNSFEELIKYDDWKNLDCICFIIDGLDEIPDIESFLSALELFLERNDEKNIKIIVSCRTNIYEKFSIRIEDSEYFYLQNLTDKQIKRLLSNNFNVEISYQELNRYRIFLENPFNLNLFGNFYKENGRFPNNISEAFELSISQELNFLNKEKFKKSDLLDIIHIEKVLQKTAITSELMQKSGIDEKDLYTLLGKDEKSLFEKISFIEKNPESANFIFRHKNYQEFLAAKYISELDTDKIISFIKIKSFNKTKPSLFNTISFLLNILDITKLQHIKKWLFDHESEILFLMESERFDLNERKPIFKKYFDDIVINKTFWIGKNGRFSLENISKFADVDYLLNIIKDSTFHFRIITSAYTILSMADLENREDEFIDVIKEKLLSGHEEKRNVYEILRVIKNQNFHIKYPELFTEITNYYKEDYDLEINHQIISMLLEFKNIDEKFSILYNCLKKLYEIRPERKRDNNVRGTKAILEKVFLRIHTSEYFIKILDILFNRKFDFKTSQFYDKDYSSKLIVKVKSFVDEDVNFLYRIIDAFLRSDDTFLYRKDGFLSKVIKVCEKKSETFEHITNNYGLTSKTFFLLIGLYSKENIDSFLNKFKNREIKIDDDQEINYFIKWVFNDDNDLGYYFESQMQNLGFSIDEKLKLPTSGRIEQERKDKIKFAQYNWDILFDKENLFSDIKTVFQENEVDIMTWGRICEIKNDWDEKTEYDGSVNSINETISKIMRNNDDQSLSSLLNILDDDYVLLSIINEHLESNKNNYIILDQQINFIKEKCIELSQNFDSENVLKFSDKNRTEYSMYINYFILKLLYFFDQKFNVFYDESFYLETLRYCNIADFSQDEIGVIDFVKSRVNEDNFNNQIIKNVNEKHLDYFSLKAHINYSLENKLQETYTKIEEFILDDGYSKDYLETYIKLIPNKISFLKNCCNQNINSYLCWSAIKILKDNNSELVFLEELAEKYLTSRKTDYLSSAINILFYLNKDNALKQYYISLENKSLENGLSKPDGFSIEDIQNYTQLNETEYLKKLFYVIYNSENKDSFDYHHSQSFFSNLIVQLSKTAEGFEKIKGILQEIKLNIQNDDSQLFYSNHLFEKAENSYFESLSQPLTFPQAKVLVENIEKPIQQKIEIVENQFNFKENSTFNGNQFGGENNTQTNNFNSYLTNSDVLKAEEILKEFQQLKIENEDWKNIFIDGMKDLIDLKEANTDSQIQESKTKLRRIHDVIVDFGKKTNDWKNLVVLPVEFHDKIPKLIELGNHLSKFLGF